MKEIPSCSSLQENEEAIHYFNGRHLSPTKDEGTLTSLGLVSRSKLEKKVNIIFITVQVCFPNGSQKVNVRCGPQETFKDLVKKGGNGCQEKRVRESYICDARESL